MDEYERAVRRAKRKVRDLKSTNNEFRDFRKAYFAVVDARIATSGDATVDGTTQRGNGIGASIACYDRALARYRSAIDDVREANTDIYTVLAVIVLVCSVAAFLAFVRVWTLARNETSENEAKLVTKNVELQIQRKILSQILHEMRNKYTAAALILEHVRSLRWDNVPLLEEKKIDDDVTTTVTTSNNVALMGELRGLTPDVTKALALLQEADALVATRLTLHRLFAGTYASETQTVDLRLLLRNRIDAASPLANTGVEFLAKAPVAYSGQDAVAVKLDLFIFTHLANNLLSNARKHTLQGTVTLSFVGVSGTTGDKVDAGPHHASSTASEKKDSSDIEAPEVPKKVRSLVFAVEDTGRGVPESVTERLFEEEVSTGDQRGVGLGLVSCRQFARAIGGDVWLHRTTVQTVGGESEGTEFRFRLPGTIIWKDRLDKKGDYEQMVVLDRGSRDEDPTTAPAPPPADSEAIPPKITAIIVEDSALIRKGLVMKLKHVGRRTSTEFAYDEHATVEAFLSATPETSGLWADPNCIILVDENLNAAGGILLGRDLITHLKAKQFNGIIISASGDDDAAQAHRDAGADLVWTKPFGKVDAMVSDLATAFAR